MENRKLVIFLMFAFGLAMIGLSFVLAKEVLPWRAKGLYKTLFFLGIASVQAGIFLSLFV